MIHGAMTLITLSIDFVRLSHSGNSILQFVVAWDDSEVVPSTASDPGKYYAATNTKATERGGKTPIDLQLQGQSQQRKKSRKPD